MFLQVEAFNAFSCIFILCFRLIINVFLHSVFLIYWVTLKCWEGGMNGIYQKLLVKNKNNRKK